VSGDDREKLSWAEIDRRRDGARSKSDRPRGKRAQQESQRATRDALAAADSLFGAEPGGAEGTALASAVRDRHGSAESVESCRAYVAGVGLPKSVDLLSIFIDTGEAELMVPALDRLLALKGAGQLEITRGLKSQLRLLADSPDDEIAGLSEDLLE
jgi:hypothetical protein